jgi:DNA-binding NtrC family response regulator
MQVLLVDDHPEVRASLSEFIGQIGHECSEAACAADALAEIRRRRPGLVITDLRMPGMDGLQFIQALRAEPDPPPIALMTAFGDAGTAVEAMRRGAIDYLRKPIDVRELHRLIERAEVASPAPARRLEPHAEPDGLVVTGEDIARLIELADRIHAAPELPCLIEGETGTGKELFARRVHHGGEPSDAPFVALNCSAIAGGLFESELFGHAPGAFTGASPKGSDGKAALAAGGTLFLDGIADLPPEQQAKLLRLIEERAWYPVGDNRQRRLQARVVCATNAGLIERVRQGRFREDLYYRLKVCHLRLPPLRERVGGAVPLARELLAVAARRRGRGSMAFEPEAEALIAARRWPGNVRELQHALERACLLVDGPIITRAALAELLDDDGSPRTPPAQPAVREGSPPLALPSLPPGRLVLDPAGCDLDAWHRAIVAEALRLNRGSPVRASAYLGVTRKVLYSLRKRYGLFEPDQPDEE